MVDIFCLFFILVAASGVVIRVLSILGYEFTDALETLAFSIALGLGFLAYIVFIIGSWGGLYKNLFLGILTMLFVASWKPFYQSVMNAATEFFFRFKQADRIKKIIFFLMAVVMVFVLAAAVAPPVGQDELCYHLVNPKAFVAHHSVYTIPYSTNSLWPYLMEMLFTLGILMRGPELAKLFHTVFFILTALAIYCSARRLTDKRIALFGVAAFFLTPATFMQATFAYIDNAVAAFFFFTFYSLFIFFKTRETKWAVLAGVFAGFLISTKYLGLFVLPLAFVVFLAELLKSEGRNKISFSGLYFALALFVTGGVWYVRSAILRGNPVFPFMSRFFGDTEWVDKVINASVHGRGTGPLSFLLVPWDLAIHPQWFGGEQVGALFLAFLPVFIFFTRKQNYPWFTFWVGTGYTVIWFFVEQNTRFFFPALAFFSVCVGSAMAYLTQTGNKGYQRIFSFLIIGLLALHGSFALYHYRDELLLLVGRSSKDHYLSGHERSYSAAQAVNRYLKETDKILSTGEARGFYFDNPFTLEGDFNNFTHYGRSAQTPEAVIRYLKQTGFTHVLSSNLETTVSLEAPDPFRVQKMLSDPFQRDQFFKTDLVVSHEGVRYVLYRIK